MAKIGTKQFENFGPGKYADGDNLHLIVSPTGQRRWVYSPRVGGKRPEYGFKATTLKEGRLERDRLKLMLAQGIDPRTEKPLDAKAHAPTFAECARRYIAERTGSFRRHTIIQWERVATFDCEAIANKPMDDITVSDIKALLLPIFASHPDKAKRVKRMIAAIFDYAADHELCDRDRRSPAEGKTLLPQTKTVKRHHTAMPYTEIPGLIAKLRALPLLTTPALEFTILTAGRVGETAGAQWSEFDLDNGIWTVPAERMGKTKKPHTVPLSRRALEILQKMKEGNSTPYVFVGRDGKTPVRTESLWRLLTVTLGLKVTNHGFRSSFRDWLGDETEHPREIAEHALSHAAGNNVELAYRRGDALKKRRQVMDDWARYIEPADNVVRLQRA